MLGQANQRSKTSLLAKRRSEADGCNSGDRQPQRAMSPAQCTRLEIALGLDDQPGRAEQGIAAREADADQQVEQHVGGAGLESRHNSAEHVSLRDRGAE